MHGQSESDMESRQRVVAACHEDWAWFHEHDTAGVRWREAVKGEFDPYEDDVEDLRLRCVLVVKLDDSHHLRLAFGKGVLAVYVADVKSPWPILELISCTEPPPKLRPVSARMMAVYEAERLGLEPS